MSEKRLLIISPMPNTVDDELDPYIDHPAEKKLVQVFLKLDPEHDAALQRISQHECLSRNNTLRRLIRLADQVVSGDASPFVTLDLQALSRRKAG